MEKDGMPQAEELLVTPRFRRKVGNRRQEGEALSGELCRLSERLCTIAGEYARAEEENRNVIDGN